MADDKKEEKKDKNADAVATKDDAVVKKKKPLILIVGAVVVLAAVGGGAAFFLLKGGKKPTANEHASTTNKDDYADPKKDEHAEKKDDHGQAKDAQGAPAASVAGEKPVEGNEFGHTYNFKTFHLNLGNPLENHYIRLEVALEYKGGQAQKEEIERRMPQLRDAVVSVASRKSREFLLGPDGKEQLRRELLIRINRYMSKPVESVYITDMLIE